MAEQESQETETIQETEPHYTTLRERHETAKAKMRAEMDADMAALDAMTPAELEEWRVKANRPLKPLPADTSDEVRNRLKLMVDVMFDRNITVV